MKIFKTKNTAVPPSLHGKERIPYEKIKTRLIALSWDSSIEFDEEFSWYILAGKNIDSLGYAIRRIRPYKITSPTDLIYCIKLQDKLRGKLVEVIPFKFYKGDRLFYPSISDGLSFTTESNFLLFRRFFKTYDFSLMKVDKNEAKEKENV